jgi:hypothetical protein
MKKLIFFLALLLVPTAAAAQDPSVAATLSSTTCPGTGCVTLTTLSSRSMASISVTGTWTGALTIYVGNETANLVAVRAYDVGSRTASATITANGLYAVEVGGMSIVRARATTLSSGSAGVRLSAGQGNVDLPVAVSNLPVTQAVSGTVAVSGLPDVTVANFPSSQAVTGTFWQATQPVSGTFWQATQPVSGTFWQATQPVSGPLTDAQLRASAVPVSGTFWQATQPVSGTFWQATQPVSAAALPLPSGASTESTLSTLNGKIPASPATDRATAAAPNSVRLSDGAAFYKATTPSDTQPVSGTFWQATQPVSGPLTDVQLRATAVPVSGTFWQTTQPVSGTVTANVGTTNGLALDATLTGGTQQAKITDGTNVATVKAASTAAVAADKAVVVAVSPNNTVGVTGTFWQATQPVSLASVPTHDIGSITTAVVPGTGATNLGKAEDATHTSGDVGIMTMGVRKDTNAQTTNADSDYTPAAFDAYGTQFTRVDHPNRIVCGADNIAATLTQLTGCGAPGVGLSIYVTDIVAQSTTTTGGLFILRYGTATNCGTGTTSLIPSAATVARLAAPANTVAPLSINFTTPLKVPANNLLCVLGVATNTTTITISGFIAP